MTSEPYGSRPAGLEVDPEELAEVVIHLRAGGFVAYPTETVWGLAASAKDARAVGRMRHWKGRTRGQPISLLAGGEAALCESGFALTPASRALIRAFWPGPLTLVLPCAVAWAEGIAREDGAVGVRCSPHPVAAALAREADRAGLGLLTATSFNRSGEAPVRTRVEAHRLVADAGRPDEPRIFQSGPDAALAEPSTVLDVTGEVPRVIRWGGVDREALESVLGRRVA